MEWNNIGKNDWTTRKGDRIFRLRLGNYGVLGIGEAYYLTTKLVDESEFKSVEAICTSGDNHGKTPDKRLLNGLSDKDQKYFIFREEKYLQKLFVIVERDYINTLY